MPKLAKQVSFIIARARDEAHELHSPALEAEHLLLAIASQDANIGKEILLEFGLDHDSIKQAVAAEFKQSLKAAGVNVEDFGELDWAAEPPKKKPGWGTSSKQAIERAVMVAVSRGDKRVEAPHLLLGVLKAREGTVPRMLQAVNIDIKDVIRRTEQVLLQGALKV